MMDTAVPANARVGLAQDEIANRGWAVQSSELNSLLNRRDVAIVDLREDRERAKQGEIPGSMHVPYASIADALKPGGVLRELGATKSLLLLRLRRALCHGGPACAGGRAQEWATPPWRLFRVAQSR